MPIPVIFIHNGNQEYLKLAIKKASERNRVVLIGNDNTNGIEFYNLSNYIDADYRNFQSIYIHLSTLPYEVELFCFLRWFILRNWMRSTNTDTVMYIDSDVLLYINAEEEFQKYFSFYDLTLVHRTSAHTSFFTRNGIENFCNFLLETYTNKHLYDYNKIASHYTVRSNHSLDGGVCDMTLLEFYQYKNYGKVGEMMFLQDNSTYDHNIHVSDFYFECKNNRKNVEFINGVPFVLNLKSNQKVKFNSLHCTGNHGKQYLLEFYRS